MSIWVVLKSLKKNFLAKKSFIVPWPAKNISGKVYEHVLQDLKNFEIKTMKYYHDFLSKCNVFLFADSFGKFRNYNNSESLFEPTSFKFRMQCLLWQKLSLKYPILTCICYLKKVWEAEFLTFLKDIITPT